MKRGLIDIQKDNIKATEAYRRRKKLLLEKAVTLGQPVAVDVFVGPPVAVDLYNQVAQTPGYPRQFERPDDAK